MKTYYLGKNGNGKPGNGSLLTGRKKPKYGKYAELIEVPSICYTIPSGNIISNFTSADSFTMGIVYVMDGITHTFGISDIQTVKKFANMYVFVDYFNANFAFIGELSWNGTNLQMRKNVFGKCLTSVTLAIFQD
jgi:hypothetical protein